MRGTAANIRPFFMMDICDRMLNSALDEPTPRLYPFASLNDHAIKLLFICSRNEWRSRTAEEIFKHLPGYSVKSAGTEPSARIRVSAGLIGWADQIFVMERKHRDILRQRFPEAIMDRPIHCLDIPDDYTFMDADLIASLQSAVSQHINLDPG
jgi:predicted protein tyrosine phosphatase